MMIRLRTLTLVGLVCLFATPALAQEPNWNGTVIARGQQREVIQSTPLLKRPYRPLHFYGNSMRRRHYRGTAVPMPKDFYGTFRALVTRAR